jgi:3-oxoacyl-(acyl-carrier-protein) synthase
MSTRVAIVAAAARTALGADLDATWAALAAGRSALAPLQGFDASGFGDPWAAQLWTEPATPEEDPAMRILGRHGHLLERVVADVHERSGLASRPPDRVGLFVSIGMADSVVDDLAPAVRASRDESGRLDLKRFFAAGYRHVHPLWPLAALNNVAAGQISIDLDLRGDNFVLSSQADGGVRALIEAMHALHDGSTDAALAGGVAEPIGPASLARLALRGVLGDGAAAPLCAEGAGVSPGEGAAAFLLQREVALGTSRPLAFLRGGATTWGRAPDRVGPTEDAFRRAIGQALAAARLDGRDIDAVFLAAEGRAAQDAAELAAVTDVCGPRPRLVATQGAIGHMGSGAPALNTALALRALADGVVPPTVTREPLLGAAAGRIGRVRGPLRRILVLGAGHEGGAGALVLEAAR